MKLLTLESLLLLLLRKDITTSFGFVSIPNENKQSCSLSLGMSMYAPMSMSMSMTMTDVDDDVNYDKNKKKDNNKKCVVIGAGWGGLSAAHTISKEKVKSKSTPWEVTVVDAAPRPGGLVRDGFLTTSQTRVAEAGMHGFWDNYLNIFDLLFNDLKLREEDIFQIIPNKGSTRQKALRLYGLFIAIKLDCQQDLARQFIHDFRICQCLT